MSESSEAFNGSFDETRKRQMGLGLALTPLERLAWLEERREEMLRLRERMPTGDEQADPAEAGER